MRGWTLYALGEFIPAREHFAQGSALYDSQQHRFRAFLYGQDPGVSCGVFTAYILWQLGYPDQALKNIHAAFTLAQELTYSFNLALALNWTATLHQFRREGHLAQERAEAAMILSTEHGFPFCVAWGTVLRGWRLAERGQPEEGITQIRQGLAAWRATGAELWRPYFLALLAEAYGKVGQAEEGLGALAEALDRVDKTGECWYEAELYRLRGELTLQKGARSLRRGTDSSSPQASSLQPLVSNRTEQEAEGYFLKAIAIAQKQQAKSLELRAAVSLARLWQQQGKTAEAHKLLSAVYNWFTEGFATKDLQEAKALLESLSS